MAKKKLSREEMKEYKNGKYTGGPAEEAAEKKKPKKFGKRMALGGMGQTDRDGTARYSGMGRGEIDREMPGRRLGQQAQRPGRRLGQNKPKTNYPGIERPPLPPSSGAVGGTPTGTPTGIPSGAAQGERPGTYGAGPGILNAPTNYKPPVGPAPGIMPGAGTSGSLSKIASLEPASLKPLQDYAAPMTRMPAQTMKKGGAVKRYAKGGLVKGAGKASRGVKAPRYC